MVADAPAEEQVEDGAVRVPPADTTPLPRHVTEATPAGEYRMTVGDSSTLQLPPGTPELRVGGDAVEVMDVASFDDPGSAQWEIRAVGPGRATIEADFAAGPRRWVVHVEDERSLDAGGP